MTKQITTRVLSLTLLMCFAGLIVLLTVRPQTVATDKTVRSATPVATPASSAPETGERRTEDLALAREIDRTIDESELAQARWGVFVMSLRDSHVIYSRNGDKLFTPASNMKIFTTAAALDLLGPDYRWRTSVYSSGQPDENGVIEGDLTLYGRGAPNLVTYGKESMPSLSNLADQLYQRGVRHVRGNIIGDESYFRGEDYGLGWQWNDLQWYFGAKPAALSINGNGVEVSIVPGSKIGDPTTVNFRPETSFVSITNDSTTGERGTPTSIGVNRGLSDNHFHIWGEFPIGSRGFAVYLSVHDPARWAAALFKEVLAAKHIQVDGEARARDFRVAADSAFDPNKATEVASDGGDSLAKIVRETNKESNNLFAELILRTIGKERGHAVSDSHQRREPGDDELGTAVVKSWLRDQGMNVDNLQIRDGSGLSRLDLVTPEATTRLLALMTSRPAASVFRESLPIAGRDGTLGSRLAKAADRVFAKTGSLTYVHSLSGYALSESGELLAFSIMCNDATVRANPVAIIDQIAGLLVTYPNPGTGRIPSK